MLSQAAMPENVHELTLRLDALGLSQTIVTSRHPAVPKWQRLGERSQVFRVGLPPPAHRSFALPAARAASRIASRADVVHAHLCLDPMVLPLAYRVARRHGLALVVSAHADWMSVLPAPNHGLAGMLRRVACVSLMPKTDAVVLRGHPLTFPLGAVDESKVHVICPEEGTDSLKRLIALYRDLVPRLPPRTRGERAAIEQQPPLARSR